LREVGNSIKSIKKITGYSHPQKEYSQRYTEGKWQIVIGKNMGMSFNSKYIKERLYL